MKTRRFGNVLPVRLTSEVDRKLKLVAKAAGITKSDALRMAINNGLPELEAGRLNLKAIEEVEAK
jgi:predicted DNA-binding protein